MSEENTTPNPEPKATGEQQVVLTKAELSQMMNEAAQKAVEGLEGSSRTRILKRVTERKVGVRMVDLQDKKGHRAVVGFKNRGSENRPLYIYEQPDPKNPKENVLYVELILEKKAGEEKNPTLAVNYNEFRKESSRATCRVVDTEEREWLINQGTVRKKEVEEYSSIELDYEVPLDVIGKVRIFTVEIPDEFGGARNVKVHEDYVNIA